jgi:pSer/pThr/pTyr-binding forkhead associated (FHA) protein
MLRALSNRLRERQPSRLKATATAEGEHPRPAPSRAMLVHQPSGTEFPVSQEGETTIGRVDRVTGISPDVDFSELDTHRTLSRRHAKISRQEDGYYLREDIGTSNGTFVNGERIKTGVPVKIQDGDEIRFGHTTTIFQCA